MTDIDRSGKAVHATEMSTTRMHHGEPHVTVWVTGPKGGGKAMLRFDIKEATKLAEALLVAVHELVN